MITDFFFYVNNKLNFIRLVIFNIDKQYKINDTLFHWLKKFIELISIQHPSNSET